MISVFELFVRVGLSLYHTCKCIMCLYTLPKHHYKVLILLGDFYMVNGIYIIFRKDSDVAA